MFNDFELLLTTRIIVSGTSSEPASHAFTARQLWALSHSFHYPETLYAVCEKVVR